MENDTIFLIVSTDTFFRENRPSLRIFENVETNKAMKWIRIGEFGKSAYDISLPSVIKPIKNKKFIFHPRKIERFLRDIGKNTTFDMKSFKVIELWEKNTTLTRSTLEFPMNLRHNIENFTSKLWIVQL